MSFSIFPTETTTYQSQLDKDTLMQTLKENTLDGALTSTMYTTHKKFIGTVEGYGFRIIISARRTSMFCVFEGQLNPETSQLTITKRFHPSFRNLFVFWVLSLVAVMVFLPTPLDKKIWSVIMFTLFAIVIRLAMIALLFRPAEAEGTEALEDLLKLKEV